MENEILPIDGHAAWLFAQSREKGLIVEADSGQDMYRRHAEEHHKQSMRHSEERHKQLMKHADELHKHNLSVAKEHHKHLSPAYLYGGGMAFNSVPDNDKDEDDTAAPDTGTSAGATTSGAGGTAGVGSTGGAA